MYQDSDLPAWHYDELRQIGTDFENPDEVAAYDQRQGSDPAKEHALIERLNLGHDDRVADLGCGTGSFALAAATVCRAVHAVDVSTAMLDHVARKAAGAGLDGLTCHHAGFLTFAPPDPLDTIVTRYALHHLPDFWKAAALRRLAAMLKPGGRLYLEDVVFSFAPESYRNGVEAWIKRMAGPDKTQFSDAQFATHVREEYSTYAWILEGLLLRSGFRVLEADTSDPAYGIYLCETATA